jgi:hypothetical protein
MSDSDHLKVLEGSDQIGNIEFDPKTLSHFY